MSFSSDVRNELARVTGEKRCCHIAELAALMRMGGAMLIGGNSNLGISFTTENAAVARKVLKLLKQGFDVKTEIMVSRALRLKKNNSYMVRVTPSALVTQLLSTLGIIDGQTLNAGKDSGIMRKICCRRAYLRGAFLGGGSVNRPEGDYHLELVTGNLDFAKTLLRLLRTFQLSAGLTDRKNDYIVYLKDGDAIGAVLQIIGAHDALMIYENVRVMKEMRNQVNRLVNCETANLQKTVNAAVRQLEAIRYIEATVGLQSLSEGLRETAELRLQHPEASLQELERAHGDQVSKSGINHRLRKLEKISEKLQGRSFSPGKKSTFT
ncbi:DNA-binding protein WhiA [Acetonema longum]|uniref:Probable cell division protein WhiA n=1 Tax=Acetonema longum DSM 6540 TaxID=1009370 RepID=F7NHI7_9FIRM|nr:DNA-binding protein WhiA [Acetonema longum]EGO64534.1 putative sporulation transcription regulator whiA [Acetonema longum DSM 6540]